MVLQGIRGEEIRVCRKHFLVFVLKAVYKKTLPLPASRPCLSCAARQVASESLVCFRPRA